MANGAHVGGGLVGPAGVNSMPLSCLLTGLHSRGGPRSPLTVSLWRGFGKVRDPHGSGGRRSYNLSQAMPQPCWGVWRAPLIPTALCLWPLPSCSLSSPRFALGKPPLPAPPKPFPVLVPQTPPAEFEGTFFSNCFTV